MADDLSIQKIRSMLDPAFRVGKPELDIIGPAASKAPQAGAAEGASFSDMLKDSITEVNNLKNEADQATEDLAMGRTDDIQGTILAVEKASVSFKMMMEVRNKIVSAYQDVMRTQI
ncbi:MAG TPA: flagellar hook-basal body complex protein FliE [Candidatus Sumerlaeota bacterium]|nr:flagellar hook-basal body complex protein FliE [Candidatus Sumerlaeota bacterium]HPS02007.1 flagellar hook-basal body complex protein FliE [Candidatus Sumerlaeota bacterium]